MEYYDGIEDYDVPDFAQAPARRRRYGCGSCAQGKYGASSRRSNAITSMSVDKYAVLRDTLARKGIRDPTMSSASAKYGARRRRRRATTKRVGGRRRSSTASRYPVRRRYGCCGGGY